MKLVTLLAIILFVPTVLLFSFSTFVYNEPFTHQLLNRYSDDSRAATVATTHLLAYYQNKELLPPPVFTREELAHLDDVKEVIRSLRVTFVWLLLIFLVLFYFSEQATVLRRGCVALLVASLFVLISFNSFFTLMHQFFFEPGSWQFSPASKLIQFYPAPFFIAYAFWTFAQAWLVSIGLALMTFVKEKG